MLLTVKTYHWATMKFKVAQWYVSNCENISLGNYETFRFIMIKTCFTLKSPHLQKQFIMIKVCFTLK